MEEIPSLGVSCYSLHDADLKLNFLIITVDGGELIIPENRIEEFKKYLVKFPNG